MQFKVTVIPTMALPMPTFSGKDRQMVPSEEEVQTAVRSGCALFKRMIANLEIRIRDERRRLAVIEASLRKAESLPKSDPALIEQLKQAIASLQSQVDEDETSLADIRIDYEMFCT
jgi:chromosome segregation ATPase